MRIAITTGTFHPESGGPPTYLHRLGAELVARGHDVRLLSFGEQSHHRYEHRVARVSRRLPLAWRLAVYTAHTLRLARWADVLFASDYGLPAALVTRFVRRPLVLRVAGDFAWESAVRRGLIARETTIDEFQPAPKRGLVMLLDRLQRWYVRRADRVIVPSAYLADLVRGWGTEPARVRVVHNAVDVALLAPGVSREEARRRLGLDGAVVLTIARLTPWKGVDRVLETVAALRDRHAARLVHCGEGPEEARMRALAGELGLGERARFEGRVPRELIPLYLAAADVFVLFSGYEGMPHVVLEAMAAGTPVVVSDRGGNTEVVEEGATGRVVAYDDPAALTRVVDELLTDRAQAARLAEQARKGVEERFGWRRTVEETLAVLEEARRVDLE